MAGPTSEVLNEDVKELREDLHKVEVALREDNHRVEVALRGEINRVETSLGERMSRVETALRGEISRVETSLTGQIGEVKADVRELSTQIKGILTAIKLLAVLAITSLAGSIWWGATLSSDVRHLASEVGDLRKTLEGRPVAAAPKPEPRP
jgi:hypothetical protein